MAVLVWQPKTLREELYNTAAMVNEAKERKKAVDAYLEDICKKAASEGEFQKAIMADEKEWLTYEDIETFAKENDIKVSRAKKSDDECIAILDWDVTM